MDLETFVAKLALNPGFREKFLDGPDAALASAGVEVAPPGVETLVSVAELLDDSSGEASFDLPGQELAGPGTGN